jgi:hypothetical protein
MKSGELGIQTRCYWQERIRCQTVYRWAPCWDLTPYQGDGQACPVYQCYGVWDPIQHVMFAVGSVDENGRLVGLPDEVCVDFGFYQGNYVDLCIYVNVVPCDGEDCDDAIWY